MLAGSDRFWRKVTRGIRVRSADHGADAEAVDAIFPWLAHDAMVHLTVPHGLEQYSGGAWGVRDVCQGPLELFLSLEHDEPAKAILRILFAQQYEKSCDWPQWFMLEPYSAIQGREAHGDVIVWPLKALCDYVEATGDFAFLDEPVAWRREDNFEKTAQADPIATHVDRLIATVRERFIPGTSPDPLRERRLERLPSAGRSDEARLDGKQLDGRASLRAASPLRRNPPSRRASAQRGEGTRFPRGGDAQGLQSFSDSR